MSTVTITLLFLLFAVVMFVLEKIPLAVTAMLVCVGLVVTGVLTPAAAFAGFVSSPVILFVGMFVVGGALFETGMASQIGGVITKLKFIKGEKGLIVVVMLLGASLSVFLSNTGTAAILIPILVGVAAKKNVARSKLLIPMVYAVALGSNTSLIATPGNMIAHSALVTATGSGFGFFELTKIGLPMIALGIIYFTTIGYKLLPNHATTDGAFSGQADYSTVPAYKRYLALAIMLFTVFLMIIGQYIGLAINIASTIGAILMVLTKVINEKQAYKAIDLKVVFLFGGTLALAAAMQASGADRVIATAVISLLGGENAAPFALLAAILLITGGLAQFMSITASVALMVPISLSVAQTMGADPRALMAATVVGASCAFTTPIATPPNVMIVGVGGYKFSDFTKVGLPLFIICLTVSAVLLPILFPFFP